MFAKYITAMMLPLLLILALPSVATASQPRSRALQLSDIPQSKSSTDDEGTHLAEEAADRFIQRWHETLDFSALFDDLYASRADRRQRNIYLFFVFYRCAAGLGYTPGFQKDVDEPLRKRAFFAIQNINYLSEECRLAFDKSKDIDLASEEEIAKASNLFINLDLNSSQKGRLSKVQITEFIKKAEYVSSVYKKNLPKSVFSSSVYKANLKESLADSKPPRIHRGWADYGVSENEKVYEISRGIFRFYFIEEEGKLKVLTLGFEC